MSLIFINFTIDGSDVFYEINTSTTNSMVIYTEDSLPGFDEILNSEGIQNITNIPGFENIPSFEFDVEQSYEN